MRVAAFQAPLAGADFTETLDLIRSRVDRCEAEGVAILCCPEAILGGLADYAEETARFALTRDRLDSTLASLASDTVTTIVGFTELAKEGWLYNSAAVFHRESVIGVYRKLHPAVNRSVYFAGCDTPVFRAGALTFGIVICYDSNFAEPARRMRASGASVLFVPTNNGLPPEKGRADLVAQARTADIDRAVENRMWVVRADVAGRAGERVSYGSSGIVAPDGRVVHEAAQLTEDLVVAEIDTSCYNLAFAERR